MTAIAPCPRCHAGAESFQVDAVPASREMLFISRCLACGYIHAPLSPEEAIRQWNLHAETVIRGLPISSS